MFANSEKSIFSRAKIIPPFIPLFPSITCTLFFCLVLLLVVAFFFNGCRWANHGRVHQNGTKEIQSDDEPSHSIIWLRPKAAPSVPRSYRELWLWRLTPLACPGVSHSETRKLARCGPSPSADPNDDG